MTISWQYVKLKIDGGDKMIERFKRCYAQANQEAEQLAFSDVDYFNAYVFSFYCDYYISKIYYAIKGIFCK